MEKWIQRKPRTTSNGSNDLLSQLCNVRGISKQETGDFLTPDRNVLNPATDLKNGTIVAERIKKAIEGDEKIVVSVDNDADGVTSTAIMVRYLQERMNKKVPYIYAERDWGHGIKEQLETGNSNEDRNDNAERNRELIEDADLLIIVDSSSNDVSTCKNIINKYKTEVIILDHHAIDKKEETMKDVGVLLVNPQQKGCRYLNKGISGAGVVYKMVGLVEELFDDGLIDTEKYMDLAGIGIYADMMPMDILENRYIVSQGLLNINNMGIERILKSAKADLGRLDGDSIGFTIAPLINGTARMGNIKDAIDLLLSDEDKEVKKIRLRMHKENEKRKALQKEMSEALVRDIDTSGKMIFIVTDESSKGFNGLVAQEIAQRHSKPVFIGRLFNGEISGSGRSFGGVQLKTFFGESGLVNFASGHEGALGIGFQKENFEAIKEYVEENMETSKKTEKVSFYDINLDASDVLDSIDLIQAFNQITGINCKKILVRIDNIMVDERKVLGSNNDTIKIKTMDDIDLIKFRVDEQYGEELSIMDSISVIGELKWNIWKKFRPVFEEIRTMQVMLTDYKAEV